MSRQRFARALDLLCTFVRAMWSLLPNLGVTGSNPVGVANEISMLYERKQMNLAVLAYNWPTEARHRSADSKMRA